MPGTMDASSPPSGFLQTARQRYFCGSEGPRSLPASGSAATFASVGLDDTFHLSAFKVSSSFKIISQSPSEIVFDLVGVETAIANALRRILISEIPTVAIETVQIWQNTGVIQDEVLAHRLGLIPFVVDPESLAFRGEHEELTDENALCFFLNVKCTERDVNPYQNYLPVYAKDLKWIPLSLAQRERWASAPPRVVEDSILITKLGCGQLLASLHEIELKAYLEKGIGKTHAKWSPVCTAVYRLLPELIIKEDPPFSPEEAKELKSLCPMGVFDIEDGHIVAKNPRNCTTCRMCLERFPSRVELRKIKNHFICKKLQQSTGGIPASTLWVSALRILQQKARSIKANLLASAKALPQKG
ncbi:Dna-directed Rna polymerase I RPAC1 [Cardiosporidium cionae]|uniref:Dna-directed Rna polymerase I RPAC1 n=1 Tax=Cardiosporidium cionae TaxID=476202 RepID=A0ABQ7JD24_9APIC|nr:Dna-directed Rna polymerase I RPAC1 [Cardiosporidium cionae]|eukprot:KAF8821774.1 Dna-directed Rna polymerase I RPAC1 [Cardiosporidium cionae]